MSLSLTEAVPGQSRSFAYIFDKKTGEAEDVVYFTNKSEDYKVPEDEIIAKDEPLILPKDKRFGILPHNLWYPKDSTEPEVLPGFKREVIYISGKSGSGKSYQIANYVKLYHKLHPNNQIYWLSVKNILDDPSLAEIVKLTFDPSLPPVGPNRVVQQIKLTSIDKVIDFKPEDVQNRLYVFDDIIDSPVTIDPKEIFNMLSPEEQAKYSLKEMKVVERYVMSKMVSIRNYIRESITLLLNVGRDKKLSCVVVNHKLSNGPFTKSLILESTAVILFPYNNVSAETLKDFLREKLSYGLAEAKKLVSLDFYEFDFLYLNTGRRFFMTPRHLEIFNDKVSESKETNVDPRKPRKG